MELSPFIYGVTVSKKAFTNREIETKKLYKNLTQGINTSIISPRRWGKSSLVEKVIYDIQQQEKGVSTVIIDLFSVSSTEEFLELFAKEIVKASSAKWQEWLQSGKTFFKHLIPKFSVGIDPATDFSISFDWEELKKHEDEILNLPETIAKKKKIKFIICLDEFQDLASFSDYSILEKKMRATWQRQKNVTYCLYGSKRHMMSEIFNTPSNPFYRFGDIMFLPKISREKWIEFIKKSFSATRKEISDEAAQMIPDSMKNHSWYVQQLAHYTWQNTENKATVKEVKAAFLELIRTNIPFYQKEIETISNTQLNLLKAVANGEKQLTSSKVMQKYKLGTPRNVSKNKTTLMNADIINEEDKCYEFLDPAFEKWFRKQFLNEDYF